MAPPRSHGPAVPLRRRGLLAVLLAFAGGLALIGLHPLGAEAAVKEGKVATDKSWLYLQRFCFDENGGHLELTAYENARWEGTFTQTILFYPDNEELWHKVYGSDSMTCAEKVEVARQGGKCNACVVQLSHLTKPAYNHTVLYPIGTVVPRWWYIATANCAGGPGGTEAGVGLDYYRIHFTNRRGFFQYEYSKDVQGILEMSIFFFALYSVLLVVLAWIKQHAKAKAMQYTVVKYVFVAVALDAFGLMLNLAHYAKFGHDGVGTEGLEHAHFFFGFLANLVLLDAVLNVCKGWAISTNYIQDRRLGYLILFALLVLYCALFGWQQAVLDPAAVVYIYELPPGLAIVAVRGALTLWAAWCLYSTYRMESERPKKQFYLVWAVFALGWLASLPIIVGIAHALESWLRQRVVFGIVNSVQAAVYLALTYLFRPFRSNRYVSILNPQESRAFGSNNMQVFPAGPPATTLAEIQFAAI